MITVSIPKIGGGYQLV